MHTVFFQSFIPEIFLSISILIQILFNTRLINSYNINYPLINKEIFFQTFFILSIVLILYSNIKIECVLDTLVFVNTTSEFTIKIMFLSVCLLSLISIWRAFLLQKLNFFEYFVILLTSIFSFLLLLSCYDLISVYLTIELQSLCFYVLSSFKRNSSFSTEAGLKYFISGAFISGFFLLGCSLIYGSIGTLNFNIINQILSFEISNESSTLNFFLILGIFLVIATFMFKISASPFHFWSPDVYEGSPLSSTLVFSIISKLPIIVFLTKWIVTSTIFFVYIKYLLILGGLSSLLFGTFFAIQQKRIKRVVIYSSIVQIGFIMFGLSMGNLIGFTAVYFFLIIYLITSILVWSHITILYYFQKTIADFNKKNILTLFLSSLSNFFDINKIWSLSFIIIFFSLAGIPPLSGFLSKMFIINVLVQEGSIVSTILLILISIVSVFYYIRILKIIFFEKKINKNTIEFQTVFDKDCIRIEVIINIVLLLLLIIVFFYPNFFLLISQYIVLSYNTI